MTEDNVLDFNAGHRKRLAEAIKQRFQADPFLAMAEIVGSTIQDLDALFDRVEELETAIGAVTDMHQTDGE